MTFDFYTERTINNYQASLGELVRFYLEQRLKAVGKDKPDFDDLQKSRAKALACLFTDDSLDSEMSFDIEAVKLRCESSEPEDWCMAGDLSRGLHGCSQ